MQALGDLEGDPVGSHRGEGGGEPDRLEVRERLVPHLRTATEIVAAADHLSRACQGSFVAGAIEHDDATDIDALFERNGLTATQRDALCDRTRAQLERSKVFLSLLG